MVKKQEKSSDSSGRSLSVTITSSIILFCQIYFPHLQDQNQHLHELSFSRGCKPLFQIQEYCSDSEKTCASLLAESYISDIRSTI